MNHFVLNLDDVYGELERMEVEADSVTYLNELLEQCADLIAKTFTRNHYAIKALQSTWKKRLNAAAEIDLHLPSRLHELEHIRQGILNEIYSLLHFGI
jgi:hypothetical protein